MSYRIIIVVLLFLLELIIELSELSISSVNIKNMNEYNYLYPLKYFKRKISSFLMLNLIYNSIIQYFIGYYIQFIDGTMILILNCLSLYLNIILRSCVLNNPEPVAYLLSYIIFIPNYIFQFAGWILAQVGILSLKILGIHGKPRLLNMNTYRKELLWDIGVHANLENEMEELKIIKSALQFRDIEIYKIMTEREHFITINISNSITSIISELSSNTTHNKIIAINDRGHILGIIRTVDILQKYIVYNNNFNIYKLINPPLFISQNATVNAVIKHFTINSKNTLFVINKNMEIIGLITLHDVVQEIFGIDDNDYYYKATSDGYILDGEYNTRILNRKMGWNLPDQYITLGDFLLFLCNGECQLYQNITWNNIVFRIIMINNLQPIRVFAKVLHIIDNKNTEEE